MSRQKEFQMRMRAEKRCTQCQTQDERTLAGRYICFICNERAADRMARNLGLNRRYKRGSTPGIKFLPKSYTAKQVRAFRQAIEEDRIPEFAHIKTKRAMLKRADGILLKIGRKRSMSNFDMTVQERGMLRVCERIVDLET